MFALPACFAGMKQQKSLIYCGSAALNAERANLPVPVISVSATRGEDLALPIMYERGKGDEHAEPFGYPGF
jgi:hypothetical protein